MNETKMDPQSALEARYRSMQPSADGPWNATLAALMSHRSVRDYLPDPLPQGALERIVAAAQSAATSSNLQTWSVVAVENPETKRRFAAIAGGQKHIEQCPLLLVWLADLSRLREVGRVKDSATDALDYLETFMVAVIDAALAAQNAVVALESMGLGSVYIGALRNKPEEVAAELGLPSGVMAVFGLCVGYPDPAEATGVKPRLPQEAILHRERYRSAVTPGLLDAHDADLKAYQEEQGIPAIGWTKAATARVRTASSLNGRDRMREALAALGFELR